MSITPRRAPGIIALALATTGCVSSALESRFESGSYIDVVEAFEADSTLHVQERALYLAGLAYALPESPAYAPDRARQIFERLTALYPEGAPAEHAAHLQQLLDVAGEVEELRARREEELAAHQEAVAELRAAITALEESVNTERQRADGLQAITDQLTREVEVRSSRIRNLEEELAALKEIDLNRPPAR